MAATTMGSLNLGEDRTRQTPANGSVGCVVAVHVAVGVPVNTRSYKYSVNVKWISPAFRFLIGANRRTAAGGYQHNSFHVRAVSLSYEKLWLNDERRDSHAGLTGLPY